MVTNLKRINDALWYTNNNGDKRAFSSIELAAHYLVNTLHIVDDDIDEALILMYSLNHTKAVFAKDGKLLHTEPI